jgi:hypothetical protein
MTLRDSMVPFRVFRLFRSLGYILGIEICYDRLTRFVDKLLNCIDGVTDDDLDFSRLQGNAPLTHDAPTSFRILFVFFISVRTKDPASMMQAQSFEIENARLPVRLDRPATMTGIPRITVAIVAQKPSHATHIALNSDFMA